MEFRISTTPVAVELGADVAWTTPRLRGGEALTFRRDRKRGNSVSCYLGGELVAELPADVVEWLAPKMDAAESVFTAEVESSEIDPETDRLRLSLLIHESELIGSSDPRAVVASTSERRAGSSWQSSRLCSLFSRC